MGQKIGPTSALSFHPYKVSWQGRRCEGRGVSTGMLVVAQEPGQERAGESERETDMSKK